MFDSHRETTRPDPDSLTDVTREALSSRSTNSLLWRVVRLLRDRLGYEHAAIALLEGDGLVWRVGSSKQQDLDFHEPQLPEPIDSLAGGLAGLVARTGKAQLVAGSDWGPRESSTGSGIGSELAVPLVHRDEVLGVLDLQSDSDRALTEADLQLLEVVASSIAPALHAARQIDRERRRARHLRLVNEISRLVMSSLDREEVVAVACQAILESLAVSFVAIVLYDKAGGNMVQGGHAMDGSAEPAIDLASLQLHQESGIIADVLRSGKSVCLSDVSCQPNYRALIKGTRASLCVPLRVMGGTVGMLLLEHSELGYLGDEHVEVMENLAGYLAQAVDNARLFEAQHRRWLQLLLINEVVLIANQTSDLAQMLLQVARQIHDRFDFFCVSLWLKEGDSAVIHALAIDEPCALTIGHRQPLSSGVVGRTLSRGETQRALPTDDHHSSARSAATPCTMCVPLVVGDEVFGAILLEQRDVCSSRRACFDEQMVMETLARSVAGAIAKAQIHQHNERLRRDLGQMIVHDLRNPLQTVRLALQELELQKDCLSDPQREAISDALSGSEEMLGLVNGLLDIARFEGDQMILDAQPTNVDDLIHSTVRRHATQFRAKSLELVEVIESGRIVLSLDRQLYRRVVSNLLSNALKFAPANSEVTVRARIVPGRLLPSGVAGDPAEQHHVLSVSDRGQGIAPRFHKIIFDKFSQVHGTNGSAGHSNGLGLTLCRFVAQAHGGQIWVESDVGQGATFYFTLPVSAPKAVSLSKAAGVV
jgi:signal transduction histidine kinase